MSERDDRLPMIQMLAHAREAVDLQRRHARGDLQSDRLLQLALLHLVQIVGEAASRVSQTGQIRHPSVPWTRARSMRHRIVHGYDQIDYDVVWDTIAEDFPSLIAALEGALGPDADHAGR